LAKEKTGAVCTRGKFAQRTAVAIFLMLLMLFMSFDFMIVVQVGMSQCKELPREKNKQANQPG